MRYSIIINKLQNRLEQIKDKVSNYELIYLFARFETEKLLEEAYITKDVFKSLNVEDNIMKEIDCVIKQIDQFLDDLYSLLEDERNHTL